LQFKWTATIADERSRGGRGAEGGSATAEDLSRVKDLRRGAEGVNGSGAEQRNRGEEYRGGLTVSLA